MALTKKLTDIAEAIRNKTGKSDLLTLDAMVVEIDNIQTGGGELPEEAYKITGNCYGRFAYNGWNWYIDALGRQLRTEGITDCGGMFTNSTNLTKIPFDINIAQSYSSISFSNMFSNNERLTEIPLIKGNLKPPTGNWSGTVSTEGMFINCQRLREIPEDYFYNFGGEAFWNAHKNYLGSRGSMFYGCYSLRRLPDLSNLVIKAGSYEYYYSLYYNLAENCFVLDEITNLPVETQSTYTSNAFYNTFNKCYRLKEMQFATQADGTPYTVAWSNQTIDLSNKVGYGGCTVNGSGTVEPYSDVLYYNSGITADKFVNNKTQYQELKNDPDWFTGGAGYSRYNHDSAVNTINSLPSTSGSGNTIKFLGISGLYTDNGAINTLTEEEIAVAAAKGWTVAIS